MPENSAPPRSDSWLALKDCLEGLQCGPWKFIRLRQGSLGEEAIDGDDVDLLGSRESVEAVLEAARSWVREGKCHLRIKATSAAKTGLHLLSRDGRHRVELDLWIDLRQLDNRKRGLTYAACVGAVTNPDDSIQQLPVAVEASIFLHHLISKRKKISTPKQLARLAAYAEACRLAGEDSLAAALEATAIRGEVSETTARQALALLEKNVRVSSVGPLARVVRGMGATISKARFDPPGRFRMVTVMGCDGSGKTTLAKRLAKSRSDVRGVYTGKHLYRKWFIYKLLVIFVRPLLFQGREKFDDTFAPLAYLLACLRLRLKLWFSGKGTVLVDRALMDFLFVRRKTDTPGFCAGWLSSFCGVRLPHVHLVVPFERLKDRKLEMTEKGHGVYDAEMFRRLARRVPTDYTLFENSGTLDESAAALDRVIDWLKA